MKPIRFTTLLLTITLALTFFSHSAAQETATERVHTLVAAMQHNDIATILNMLRPEYSMYAMPIATRLAEHVPNDVGITLELTDEVGSTTTFTLRMHFTPEQALDFGIRAPALNYTHDTYRSALEGILSPEAIHELYNIKYDDGYRADPVAFVGAHTALRDMSDYGLELSMLERWQHQPPEVDSEAVAAIELYALELSRDREAQIPLPLFQAKQRFARLLEPLAEPLAYAYYSQLRTEGQIRIDAATNTLFSELLIELHYVNNEWMFAPNLN